MCDCGNTAIVNTNKLTSGNTKSCGCLNRDLVIERHKDKPSPNRKEYGYAAMYRLYDTYKRNAIKRDYEWDITVDQFREITSRACHYCGVMPNQVAFSKANYGRYIYNGIDRANNDLGYFMENCLPCCAVCNRAKSAMSYDEFMAWIDRLVQFRG